MRGALRTLRYARSWKAGAEVEESETWIERDGETIEATLVLPARRVGRLPAWVALGGVSRMGRRHPQLVRFTRALASTGAAVLVPEVPEWRRLRVDPRVAAPTLRASIARLRTCPEVAPDRVALIGFSFGAPQVALASVSDDLADQVAGIVLFGSYCCLDRTVACQFTGLHEWNGTEYQLSPDPYGRWVLGSNHLTQVPGHEDAHDVAEALHQLARAASEQRVSAWDPHHDPMIGQLRATLPSSRRRLFDLFATRSGAARPDQEELGAMASKLADACRRLEPLMDPTDGVGRVGLPTRLIHGRGDRLIPFTEGMRLMAHLSPDAGKALTVTGLIDHSADRTPASAFKRARESVALFESIRGLINTV
jgi:pimeloyl-ACP methyl ester carboxylesterase